jgi:uncharacterized membrane protein YcfT
MDADYSRIWSLAIAALVVLAIYRRLRRSFGRQQLQPRRMVLRIAVLLALGASLLPAAMRSGEFLIAEAAGIATGVALALWGAERTRYVKYGGRLYYVPHTYTGIAISLLVLGRLVYRGVEIYTTGADSAQHLAVRNPLTVALLFVLIGYYVFYYSRVLWKSKHVNPEDLEEPSAAAS